MKKILVFLLLIFYINAESVVFTYSVKANGRILPEVKSSDPDAYAGNIVQEITDIAIKASRGQVSYRVHVKNGGGFPMLRAMIGLIQKKDMPEMENQLI